MVFSVRDFIYISIILFLITHISLYILNKWAKNVRKREGMVSATYGIVGNLFLFGFKLWLGIYGNSRAIVADALHSLSDSFTSIVVLVGIIQGNRDADSNHPYGHGDAESIAGFFVSILIVLMGFEFLKATVQNYFKSHRLQPQIMTLAGILITVLYKLHMSNYVKQKSKKLKSPALLADAFHHRTDVYSSLIVMIGVAASYLGYIYIDTVTAVVISLYIIYTGLKIAYLNIKMLMGTVDDPEIMSEIRRVTEAVDSVVDVHKIKLHYIGIDFICTIHTKLDGNLSLKEAHKISHEIQGRIMEIPGCIDATVHIEPA